MIYYNNDNTQCVKLPDTYSSNIAVSMSGGADSTILAYILAKQIIDNNLNVKILAYTRSRNYPTTNPKTWNAPRAREIIDTITKLLGSNVFADHVIDYPDGQMELNDELMYVRNIQNRIREQYGCDIFLYGVTANPSIEDMTANNFISGRMPNRDKSVSKEDKWNPFKGVDKKFIYTLYEQTNTLDTLFPLTFSCEGSASETNNYTTHCQECWWCRERFWAFGRYA